MAQVILINSQKKPTGEISDYVGLIQTFKKFINESVVDKMESIIKAQKEDSKTLKNDIEAITKSLETTQKT